MKYTKLLFSLAILLFACNRSHKSSDKALSNISAVHNPFLDSVLAKAELSSTQVKKTTLIDTSSSGSDHVNFRGDTVYYKNSKHPLVIIVENTNTCAHYYLLVFNKSYTINTDCKLVKNDCDYDDQSFSSIDFTVANDSLFYIKDIYIKMFKDDNKEPERKITGKHYYKITPKGKIIPTKSPGH